MKISKLQIVEPKDWGGLTTDMHLGAMFQEQPFLISDVIDTLFKVNRGGDDYVSFINKFSKKYIPEDKPFDWLLQGADERNYPILDYWSDEAGTTKPTKTGFGISTFYMDFPTKFDVSAVLFGHKEQYKVRVTRDPISIGQAWRHPVELVTGDMLLFIPAAELVGTRWNHDFGLVPQTLSERGTGVTHTSPYRMENVLSMMRKDFVVPGNMISKGANAPLAFKWLDQDGKPITTWIGKLEYDFMKAWRREQARLLLYGNSNRKTDGTYGNIDENGYEIRAGHGLYEQFAQSNIFYYPVGGFSVDVLTDRIMDMTVGKFPEDSRRIVLSTGEYGAYQFHKDVVNNTAKYTPNFTTDRIQMLGGNKMSYRGQFVKYSAVQGIEFEIFIDPMKDDPVRNKILHPSGGLASSYTYDILDFGTSNGKDNIRVVSLEGEEEMYAYINGLRSPYIPYTNMKNPAQAASKVDGYTVMRGYIGGMQIQNPMSCASFRNALLY